MQGSIRVICSFRVLAQKGHSLLFHREYESIWEWWGCLWVTGSATWDQPSSHSSTTPLRSWGWVDRVWKKAVWQLQPRVGRVSPAIVKPYCLSVCEIILQGIQGHLVWAKSCLPNYKRKMLWKHITKTPKFPWALSNMLNSQHIDELLKYTRSQKPYEVNFF